MSERVNLFSIGTAAVELGPKKSAPPAALPGSAILVERQGNIVTQRIRQILWRGRYSRDFE